MRLKLKPKLKYLPFLAFLLYVTVFSAGILVQTNVQFKVQAKSFEEGDIYAFLDSEAINITYSIAPAVGLASQDAGTSHVFKIDRIRVKAGTVPYSILQSDDSYDVPTLHAGNPQFLQAYWTAAKLTGEYRINKLYEMARSPKLASALSTSAVAKALSILATSNDTSQAEGFVKVETEKIALTDISAPSGEDVPLNLTDSNVTVFSANIDTAYANIADLFAGNTSDTDFISSSDLEKEKTYDFSISGFENTEKEGFLDILKANLAANHSTPSDVVTPDRITILDYTINNVNMTNYISENFQKKVRSAIDDALETATVKQSVKLLGIKVVDSSYKFQDYKERLSPQKVNFLLEGIGRAVGKVFSLGKAVVSAPINAAAKVMRGIKNTVTSAIKTGGAIIRTAISKPVEVIKAGIKTVGSVATSMVKGAKNVVGKVVDTGGKLVQKGLSVVGSVAKGLFGNLPMLALLLGLGGAGVLLFFIVGKSKGWFAPGSDRDKYRPY